MLKWIEVKDKYGDVKVANRIHHSSIAWTVEQIMNMNKDGELGFDHALQRALVWDEDRKSLLIHSLIKNFPIDPIKAVKDGNTYQILDGKQRLLGTVIAYINGDFKLHGVPEIDISDVEIDDDKVDINDCFFEDLPKSIQTLIKSTFFNATLLDENTDEEDVNEMFYRCNNYKAMTALDMTRAKAKSQKVIFDIAKHPFFNGEFFTASALKNRKPEELVIKMYVIMNYKDVDHSGPGIRKIMTEMEISSEDKRNINKVLNRMYNMSIIMREKKFDDVENAKTRKSLMTIQTNVAKRLTTPTHMISCTPIIMKTIEDGLSDKEAVQWFESFFVGKARQGASVSALYNEFSKGSTAKKKSVETRRTEIEMHYNKWIKKFNKDKMKEAIEDSNKEDIADVQQKEITEDVVGNTVETEVVAEDVNAAVETEVAEITEETEAA